MNTYFKAVLLTGLALAASAAVAARSAEPEHATIVLPSAVVSSLLVYLNARPYQEVAGLMANLQRCLQDQVPDDKGNVAERGGCPEIGIALRHMKTPLLHTPPSP